MKSTTVVMALSFSVAALGGCASYVSGLPAGDAEPFFTSGANASEASRSLPRPSRKVVAAVYGIQDQTGKLSFGPFGPDAGMMLVHALRNAGGGAWFDVVDRDGLRTLAARQSSNGDQPPKAFKAIAIDCVITRFETATEHGGEGARLLNSGGASPHWRISVSVDLRIANPFTGKRLGRVAVQEKLYAAPEPDGGVRYVSVGGRFPTRTGEALVGVSELALREAMEKAVQGLVFQGAAQKLWAVSGSPAPKKKLTALARAAKTGPAKLSRARSIAARTASIKRAAARAGATSTLQPAKPEARTPEAQTPVVQTPEFQTTDAPAPKAQAPQGASPKAQAPQGASPKFQAHEVQTPPVKTPAGIPAEAMSPLLMTPELKASPVKPSPLTAPEANPTTQSLAPASPTSRPAASPVPWLSRMQAFGEVK